MESEGLHYLFCFCCQNCWFEILKKYGRQMTKEQNRVFRSSGFYKEISSRKQENWKAELRRWMMKANLYRVYLP